MENSKRSKKDIDRIMINHHNKHNNDDGCEFVGFVETPEPPKTGITKDLSSLVNKIMAKHGYPTPVKKPNPDNFKNREKYLDEKLKYDLYQDALGAVWKGEEEKYFAPYKNR